MLKPLTVNVKGFYYAYINSLHTISEALPEYCSFVIPIF